jgi:hypothetical protein
MKKNDYMSKPVYISFRTTEKVREILEKLAKDGYRSLSQQCEMLILQRLKQMKIDVEEE